MKLKEQVARAIANTSGCDENGIGEDYAYYTEEAQAVINEFVDYLETEAERLQEKHFASAATYRAIAKQLSGEQEKG